MNVERLNGLVSHLEKVKDSHEAARFNMKFWGDRIAIVDTDPEEIEYRLRELQMLEVPKCNTQACLAGETVLASGIGTLLPNGGIDVSDAENVATGHLELTYDQKERLFFFSSWSSYPREHFGWPKQFEDAYNAATTPAARVQVAIDRVKHFIATEGRE